MKPEDLKKLKQLLSQINDDTIDYDKDFDLLNNLQVERQKEQLLSKHKLTCCEEAQKFPAITFRAEWIFREHEGQDKLVGKWTIALADKIKRYTDPNWDKAVPKFCPFCGTKLPEMILTKPITNNVFKGEDFCQNCSEHSMDCVCDMPETLFEEKK